MGTTHAFAVQAIYGVAASSPATFAHISGLAMGGPLTVDFGSASLHDFRTFDAGITYHDVEVIDILLGRNNDTFTVNKTLPDTITVLQGGGGSDNILVNSGGGPDSPLIIFGDTSQDGSFYDSVTSSITGRGRQFTNPGDDFIDARA